MLMQMNSIIIINGMGLKNLKDKIFEISILTFIGKQKKPKNKQLKSLLKNCLCMDVL
jgi:hypothetical protein